MSSQYTNGTPGVYRSARKMRAENAGKEWSDNATLKAAFLANMGLTGASNLDGTFAIENTTDATKKVAFDASGVTTANTVTLSPPVATGASTLVGTAATQTLTNKTLTSPVVNLPTVKNLTEVVTTANVLAATETGSLFFLGSATGFVTTLPAPAAGLNFMFIVSTAPTSGSHTVICASSGTLIKGHVLTNDVNSATDSDFGTAGELTLTFVVNKSVAGDRAVFHCDGTNWFVQAACSVFDAITIS